MPPENHHIAHAFRAAFPVSLPVLAGYLFLGAGYGILMHNIGYGPFWTGLLSAMVLGGTIQYVATTLLVLNFSPVNALVVSLILNARHLFYGFSMLERYSGTGWKKPFLVFWLTDETFSLVCTDDTPPGVDKDWFRFFVSGLNYCYWIGGGLVGNIASDLLAFDSRGIEFVMTALFTVIVVNQWKSAKTHYPALIGVVLPVICIVCIGPHNFLIPAMAAIAVVLMLVRPKLEPLVRPEALCAEEEGEARP